MPRARTGEATKRFGNRLRQLREGKGWDKTQLAAKLGCTHPAINKYEAANNSPNVEVLAQLADIFDCSVDYLMGRTDQPNYVIVKGEQIPKELRDRHVDAVEVLRSKVEKDGGMSLDAQREVLRIVAEAKLLKYGKPRPPKPDKSSSSSNPPDN